MDKPPEGTAWAPNLSGNSVSWDGSAVVKRYGAQLDACALERAVLTRLTGLPVPHVLEDTGPGELRLGYVDGVNGRDVVEAGRASDLLGAMGRFLRQLHHIDPASVADILPGDGSAIVHGDFAHYNCLMAADEPRLVAVLDWEVAHLGNPVVDLAWCEWQFLAKFPRHAWALASLFEGYGATPDAHARAQALQARLDELRRG